MKSRRREKAALDFLQSSAGYMFQELPRNDRTGMMTEHKRNSKKLIVVPAVKIKLIVPADSALGEMIIKSRKATP